MTRKRVSTRLSLEERFWHYVDRNAEDCWEWRGSKIKAGYGMVYMGGREIYAHRFSYELHNGQIPADSFVCHHCDNPGCVRPDHLFIGTAKDNSQDMVAKGRSTTGDKSTVRRFPGITRGENNGNAILTEANILEIRRLWDSRFASQKQLADRYHVHKGTIFDIVHRINWKHLP